MVKKAAVAMLIAVVATVVVTMVTVKTYPVRLVDNGAELWWDADEAYLFIGTSRLGWQRNYLEFYLDIVANYLRLSRPAQNTRSAVVVLRLTLDGVEQHIFENASVGSYRVFEGHIYTYENRSLLRWSGTRFEHVSADEERRFAGAKIPSGEFFSVNGWSYRCCVLHRRAGGGETEFAIELGGQQLVLKVNDDVGVSVTVDLQRPNQQSQRIWSLDERPRRVSKDEYYAFLNQ